MIDVITIYADFQNADVEGFGRLSCDGTRADLERAGISLSEGSRLILSDGDLKTEAVVVKPGSEKVWRARIDWAALLDQ